MVLESRIVPLAVSDPSGQAGSEGEVDGVDRLLADVLLSHGSSLGTDPVIAVINAPGPGLLNLIAQSHPGSSFLVHNDLLNQEHAVRTFTARPMTRIQADEQSDQVYHPQLFSRADIVLYRLPKSLGALTDLARAAAASLRPHVPFIGAQRDKHLTHSATTELELAFESVTASLGRFKSRALVAHSPRPQVPPVTPTITEISELGLTMSGLGGVFSGTRLDIGTRFLLETLPGLMADYTEAQDFVDLGCGTGLLSAWVARNRPTARVTATDLSLAAVRSTRATAQLNALGDRIRVVQADSLAGFEQHSADVVVCNPPFHTGTRLETETARRMFTMAGQVLRPNAEMWTVFNTPLSYSPVLSRAVGPTEVIAQNSKFQVTRSTTPVR